MAPRDAAPPQTKTSNEPDTALRSRTQAEIEFDHLFRTLYPRLLAFAYRRCQNRATAEEVTNEAFLVAWRRWGDVPDNAFPWLAETVRKQLANVRRGDSRRVPSSWDGHGALLNPSVSVEEEVIQRRLIAMAFNKLTDRDREILRLVFWDGLSNREAAESLGCGYSTLTLRLHRARRRFSKALDEINDDSWT